MTTKKKGLVIVGAMLTVVIVGTAIFISVTAKSDWSSPDGSKTPLGGLFGRAMGVSRLKEQMGDLRETYPAMMKYAEAHEDELPKTILALHPYLPKRLAYLDDKDWELPSAGKMKPLTSGPNSKDAVLLQQKSVSPNKPRIIVYADGHIEYKQ
jgi:hypothetical protein